MSILLLKWADYFVTIIFGTDESYQVDTSTAINLSVELSLNWKQCVSLKRGKNFFRNVADISTNSTFFTYKTFIKLTVVNSDVLR